MTKLSTGIAIGAEEASPRPPESRKPSSLSTRIAIGALALCAGMLIGSVLHVLWFAAALTGRH